MIIIQYSRQLFPAHDKFFIVFITQSRLTGGHEVETFDFDRFLIKRFSVSFLGPLELSPKEFALRINTLGVAMHRLAIATQQSGPYEKKGKKGTTQSDHHRNST